jgi:hypothetical protein
MDEYLPNAKELTEPLPSDGHCDWCRTSQIQQQHQLIQFAEEFPTEY